MATRACIAMPKGKSWVGVYSHWDGYPTGLGDVLWTLLEHRYLFDVQRARKEIIEDNPEGWSSLGCFHSQWGTLEAVTGWNGVSKLTVDQERQQTDSATFLTPGHRSLPVSYQGDPARSRGLIEPPLNPKNCPGSGIEYIYVLHDNSLDVWDCGSKLRRMYRWAYCDGRPIVLMVKAA